MSIRTKPMKAVPVLLKRVKTTRSIFHQRGRDESLDGKLEKLTRELNKIEDVFIRVKRNQDELLDTLHEVDGHLRKLDSKRLDQDMDGICRRIRDCVHKLLPMDAFDDSEDDNSTQILQSQPSSIQHNNEWLLAQHVDLILEKYQRLEYPLQYCLVSLLVFPEHAVIKKRHPIYWWIGRGLVKRRGEKTAEEVGEDVIHELLKLHLIVPYGNGNCPIVNKFKINPRFRPYIEKYVSREYAQHVGFYLRIPSYQTCLVLDQKKVTLGDEVALIRIVFNLGASYLDFGSQWSDQRKDLLMLQLGRWQDSPSHHIEVGSLEFLKDLSDQKYLKYLSFRGISRIPALPPSIAQIESLEILDLKACHNLEALPDISSMKSLTHLLLSECYLLDRMPKGIEKLTQLQVLKGFVIGSSRKTPCRISDLVHLKKLRRLSIHIGSEAVIEDKEFESLEELSALEHLKISWGVSETRYNDIQVILPPRLKKLHLEGFPGQNIPEWLKPSKLSRGFKELKIMGGKLESMNHGEDMDKWGIEIVHLKYLKHLTVDLTNLQELFPLLRYAEIKQILNHSYLNGALIEERGESKSIS